MTLTLLAVSLNERPLSKPITGYFDSRGGTIGRADHNTMALPDPGRHVSRQQAEIVASSTGFLILNVGAANPIMVAGRWVGRGESAGLSHGDEVRIGGYLLRVECRAQQTAVDITRGRAVVSDGMVPLAPRTGGDPFADLRGNAGPASAVANTSHAPAAATAPVRPAGAPSVNPTDGHALWAALCEGAGIDLPLSLDDPEERMREVGRILRSAVEGTLRLMTVRASTKHELRAAVTVIQADGNNPLKFSPDAKSGLEYLLQPGVRGFLEGPAAMDDAMHDLVGHSIGTVAGMRAAIAGMLERFAPCELEAKLVGRPMLDSMLPINRKARLWDLYLQHHDTIREEAQEDFHAMFGKAFVAAYDQEMAQLQRKPR